MNNNVQVPSKLKQWGMLFYRLCICHQVAFNGVICKVANTQIIMAICLWKYGLHLDENL